MKTPQKIAIIVLSVLFILSLTSCAVFVKKDNGKHKGWYKNSNNPHNPSSTKQTGNGKSNGNSKGKSK
jgi:hypothetical protein